MFSIKVKNLVIVSCILLCVYSTCHLLMGKRGLIARISLKSNSEKLLKKHFILQNKCGKLEHRVDIIKKSLSKIAIKNRLKSKGIELDIDGSDLIIENLIANGFLPKSKDIFVIYEVPIT